MTRLRPIIVVVAVAWFVTEWAIALPPLLHDGFGPWHEAALTRLRHDTAFQLVVLDYVLAYLVAFAVTLRDARRREPRRWPLWAVAFLLATAPALLLYWALPQRK